MTTFRLISLSAHGAAEMLLGLVLMVAPFALGLSAAALVIAFVIGAIVAGVGLSSIDESYGSIAAHHGNDIGLAFGMLAGAVGLLIAGDVPGASVLAAAGLIQTSLLLTTRYSATR